jgi:predicted membrane protein
LVKSARNWDDFRPFFTLRLVFVAFLVRILPYLRSSQREIFITGFFYKYFTEYFFILKLLCEFFYQLIFLCKKKFFFSNIDSKTAKIRQKKPKPCKVDHMRQKSARNWQSAKNIFYPSDNFQIRQNFANLAVKTAIWQRWTRQCHQLT